MIKGIIFDKDGTLTDFQSTWKVAAQRLLEALAGDTPDLQPDLGKAIGYDVETGLFVPGSVGVTGPESAVLDALNQALPGVERQTIEEVYFGISGEVEQVPAVELAPLFRRLSRAGFVLGIVTNDTERPAREQVAEFGINHYVRHISGSDSGHGAKPGPGQLLAFARATGLPVSDIVMVGDSHYDLEAARAANMKAIGVLTGAAELADLALLSDAVLPDIGHLPGWLGLD